MRGCSAAPAAIVLLRASTSAWRLVWSQAMSDPLSARKFCWEMARSACDAAWRFDLGALCDVKSAASVINWLSSSGSLSNSSSDSSSSDDGGRGFEYLFVHRSSPSDDSEPFSRKSPNSFWPRPDAALEPLASGASRCSDTTGSRIVLLVSPVLISKPPERSKCAGITPSSVFERRVDVPVSSNTPPSSLLLDSVHLPLHV